jgi:hypothetical protein
VRGWPTQPTLARGAPLQSSRRAIEAVRLNLYQFTLGPKASAAYNLSVGSLRFDLLNPHFSQHARLKDNYTSALKTQNEISVEEARVRHQ